MKSPLGAVRESTRVPPGGCSADAGLSRPGNRRGRHRPRRRAGHRPDRGGPVEGVHGVAAAPHDDLRGRARRQPEDTPADEAPAAAQEAPGPGRVPPRGGTPRAPGLRAPEGPADRGPVQGAGREHEREAGEPARWGLWWPGVRRPRSGLDQSVPSLRRRLGEIAAAYPPQQSESSTGRRTARRRVARVAPVEPGAAARRDRPRRFAVGRAGPRPRRRRFSDWRLAPVWQRAEVAPLAVRLSCSNGFLTPSRSDRLRRRTSRGLRASRASRRGRRRFAAGPGGHPTVAVDELGVRLAHPGLAAGVDVAPPAAAELVPGPRPGGSQVVRDRRGRHRPRRRTGRPPDRGVHTRRHRAASPVRASVANLRLRHTSIGYARVSKTGRAMCSPSGSSTAFAGQGTQVDTTTAVGRERELIRERAVAGLKDRVGSRTEGRRQEVRADERLIQSAMAHRERPVGPPLRELRPTVWRFFAPLLFVDLAVLAAIGLAAPIGDDSVGGPC